MTKRKDIIRSFTTSNGTVIGIKSLSPLMLQKVMGKFERDNPEPKKPTYVTVTGAGEEEIHDHDEMSCESTEEKKEWEDYINAHDAWEAERSSRIMRVIVSRGVNFDMPKGDDWIEEHEFLGMEVPESKLEKQIHWFETEIIGSPNDIVEIMSLVLQATGIDSEVMNNAEDLFRNQTQGEQDNSKDATE